VTGFELNQNAERPTSFSGTAIDDRSVWLVKRLSRRDTQPPWLTDGRSLNRLPRLSAICASPCWKAGRDADHVGSCAERSGVVRHRVGSTTTAHMLRGVLQPHDVIQVEGMGAQTAALTRLAL